MDGSIGVGVWVEKSPLGVFDRGEEREPAFESPKTYENFIPGGSMRGLCGNQYCIRESYSTDTKCLFHKRRPSEKQPDSFSKSVCSFIEFYSKSSLFMMRSVPGISHFALMLLFYG